MPTNAVVGKVATLGTLMVAQGSPGGWRRQRAGSRGEGAAEARGQLRQGRAEVEGQRRRRWGQQRGCGAAEAGAAEAGAAPCNLRPPRAGHRGGWGGVGATPAPTLPQATGHGPTREGHSGGGSQHPEPAFPADPSAFCRSRGSGKSQPAELGWKASRLACPGVQAARRAGGV